MVDKLVTPKSIVGGQGRTPRRIVFVIKQLYPGGAETRLLRLVRNLDRSRYDAFICCLESSTALLPDFEKAGVTVRCVRRRRTYDLAAFMRLLTLVKAQKPHIIHEVVLEDSLEMWGRLAGILLRVPVVIASEGTINPRRTKWGFWVDRMLGRATDAVLVNSHALKSFVEANSGLDADKCRVIHGGIHLGQFTELSQEEMRRARQELGLSVASPVVGIVANSRPLKDLATFLRAAQRVVGAEPNTKLLVIGQGWHLDELAGLARELHLESNVLFLGLRRDVGRLVGILDVGVCSSLCESCSNAILEYMAMGKPVVATRVGGNPELVVDGRTGLLVPAQNPRALADAILRLLRDTRLASQMGRAGRDRVGLDFSVERMANRTQEVYEELLTRKLRSVSLGIGSRGRA